MQSASIWEEMEIDYFIDEQLVSLYLLLLIYHCRFHTDFKHQTKSGHAFICDKEFSAWQLKCALYLSARCLSVIYLSWNQASYCVFFNAYSARTHQYNNRALNLHKISRWHLKMLLDSHSLATSPPWPTCRKSDWLIEVSGGFWLTALGDGVGDSDKMAASILHRSGRGRPAKCRDLILVPSTRSEFSNYSLIIKKSIRFSQASSIKNKAEGQLFGHRHHIHAALLNSVTHRD